MEPWVFIITLHPFLPTGHAAAPLGTTHTVAFTWAPTGLGRAGPGTPGLGEYLVPPFPGQSQEEAWSDTKGGSHTLVQREDRLSMD